jgi:hypothetical protein
MDMVGLSNIGIKKQLVGGFNHLEKYESQWEGLSHISWFRSYIILNLPSGKLT